MVVQKDPAVSSGQAFRIPRPVLVIEDNAEIRATFRDLLESRGYSVVTACHGREGLEVLGRSVPPMAIFLDMRMPVMDGEQFLNEISRNPEWSAIPVIVFSVSDQTIQHAAVAAQMRKPANIDELFEVLEEQCLRHSNSVLLH